MTIPQTIFRPYRVVENAPLAAGMIRLVLEAADEALPTFQAGQWVNIRLLHPDGSERAKGAYSIASPPSHGTRRVEFGVKVSGNLTRQLAALVPGDCVELQGPWGAFTYPPGTKQLVCMAGGIGVTPFISMIREAASSGRLFTLIYSIRTAEEAAYLDELNRMAAQHPNLTVCCTCTRGCPPHWDGQEGRINLQLLQQVDAAPSADTHYLLCGREAFVQSMRTVLEGHGVDLANIKQESFG